MNREIDIRHVLPTVRVPTLVLHGAEDKVIPVEVARYVARAFRRRASSRSRDRPPCLRRRRGHQRRDPPLRQGVWEAGGWEEAEPDRVLATVLFTDIVGSTAKAAELGDRNWRELLERHHALIRRELVALPRRGARRRRRRLLRAVRRPGPRGPLRLCDHREHSGARARAPRRPPHRRVRGPGRQGRRHRGPHRRTSREGGAAGRSPRLEHGEGSRRRLGPPLPGERNGRAERRPGAVAPLRGRERRVARRRAGVCTVLRLAPERALEVGGSDQTSISATMRPDAAASLSAR